MSKQTYSFFHREIVVPYLQNVGVVQHLQDLELPVLVPFVLEDLLNGDTLAVVPLGGLVDNPEGALANDLVDPVEHFRVGDLPLLLPLLGDGDVRKLATKLTQVVCS